MIKKTELQHILSQYGIDALNTMQEVFLSADEHPHKILRAVTGSGKTLAYLLDIYQHLDPQVKGLQAIVVLPTRELVLQVRDVWKRMKVDISSAVFYGGHDIEKERHVWATQPTVLFCTPGRFLDHLDSGIQIESKKLMVVLDEFDKLLELGFQEEIERIFSFLPMEKSLTLVSATELDVVPEFIASYEFHVVDKNEEADLSLKYYVVNSEDKDKLLALDRLILSFRQQQCIVFVSHRQSVDRIVEYLQSKGFETAGYHGGYDQYLREERLIMFHNGSISVLVATDLAARGLDIDDIPQVIHYHLPISADEFTHRNGRTGRQGKDGKIFIIKGPEETLPDFITAKIDKDYKIDMQYPVQNVYFGTVMMNAGKSQKIRKLDVVGFFLQQGGITKEELGMIVLQDHATYIAIHKNKIPSVLGQIRGKKIKGKSYIVKRVG